MFEVGFEGVALGTEDAVQ